jgi:signal peptidase I
VVDVEKRRYPIVAFLLSLVWPGLGQVYNGRPVRCLVFLAASLTMNLILGLVGMFYTFWGLTVTVLAELGWHIAVATDAALLSRKSREMRLGWYNRWYWYVGFVLVFAVVPNCFPDLTYHVMGVRTFRTPSANMEPTLKVGDCFMVRLHPYKHEKPQRGDIVVFPYPEDRSTRFVKRLIGLGGEKFEIRNKQVFIDGKPIEEPYKQHGDPKVLPRDVTLRDDFGPITIPEGSAFVMGDNRDFSHDSRFFGEVPVADLEAKALYIYWADDISRIGTALK